MLDPISNSIEMFKFKSLSKWNVITDFLADVDEVDLQVDLALVDELRFGGVLAADLGLDSCLRCGGLQVTLGSCRSLFRLAPCLVV